MHLGCGNHLVVGLPHGLHALELNTRDLWPLGDIEDEHHSRWRLFNVPADAAEEAHLINGLDVLVDRVGIERCSDARLQMNQDRLFIDALEAADFDLGDDLILCERRVHGDERRDRGDEYAPVRRLHEAIAHPRGDHRAPTTSYSATASFSWKRRIPRTAIRVIVGIRASTDKGTTKRAIAAKNTHQNIARIMLALTLPAMVATGNGEQPNQSDWVSKPNYHCQHRDPRRSPRPGFRESVRPPARPQVSRRAIRARVRRSASAARCSSQSPA